MKMDITIYVLEEKDQNKEPVPPKVLITRILGILKFPFLDLTLKRKILQKYSKGRLIKEELCTLVLCRMQQ
jgi:hypothetical protein